MRFLEQSSWITYSSRIQLPTDIPPQLMPVVKLWAMLSRRSLSAPAPFIGLPPPCSRCDHPSPVDGLPAISEGFALSASAASRVLFSPLSVICKAEVKLDLS